MPVSDRVRDFKAKERILIVEVNWLGDVLFSTPAIRAIRKKHPGAYIAVLVVPRAKAILMGNNYIDEVIVLNEKGRYRGLKGKLRLIRDLRVRRFDIAYIFHRSLTRTLCVFLAGIGRRIGYDNKKRGFLLTQRVRMPEGAVLHRGDLFYYLVTGVRIPDEERHHDFFISVDDKIFIKTLLERHHLDPSKKIVVIHAGGNWDLKRWPKENFACLIDLLAEKYGVQSVITGSFMEHALAKEIAALTKHPPFIACGMTTLKQLGALFQASDFVISADSGPLHIALAMKARTISLFGPTSPEVTGPFGRGEYAVLRNEEIACVIPCYNLECQDNICMRSITAEDVLKEAEKKGWLERTK